MLTRGRANFNLVSFFTISSQKNKIFLCSCGKISYRNLPTLFFTHSLPKFVLFIWVLGLMAMVELLVI
jgi:hypothetical protein